MNVQQSILHLQNINKCLEPSVLAYFRQQMRGFIAAALCLICAEDSMKLQPVC